MTLSKRQARLLARPLSSLKKLSPYAQNWLITDAHNFRRPGVPLKLTPKTRKALMCEYTIGDVFERWKQRENATPQANPTGLTHPHGPYSRVIDVLVKAGFTRLDHPWLPQETLTLKVMRTRTKEEWLNMPLYFLGTLTLLGLTEVTWLCGKGNLPGYWARGSNKDDLRSVTVRDLLTICETREGRPYPEVTPCMLWENRVHSMANTQKLLYELGFTYEDSPVMQYGTDRKAIEGLMERHKISKRTARMVIRIAHGEHWKVRTD